MLLYCNGLHFWTSAVSLLVTGEKFDTLSLWVLHRHYNHSTRSLEPGNGFVRERFAR